MLLPMDKKLAKVQRLREALKSAPPAKCARVCEQVVRLLDGIAK